MFVCLTCAVAITLFSCRAKKAVKQVPQEKTVFYTLLLTKDSLLNKTTAELKNANIIDTKVRYNIDETKTHDPNFLKIEITEKGGKMVNVFTEHPLYKRLELYSESGKIESKLIPLSQGEVTFRIPYFEKYKRITIVEVVNFKELKPIILKNEK